MNQTLKRSADQSAPVTDPQGIVLNIQRCSMDDGPGIRTTVFLKGCPLTCVWCHNPEAINPRIEWARNTAARPAQGHCLERKSSDTPTLYGEKKSVSEIMAEVVRDKEYYETSGGGMTVSGGEPLAQTSFTWNLLTRAKEAGIHTCVDTSGHAPWSAFEKILPCSDLFHYDYKETDSERHRQYTGVGNERILENLHKLMQVGANLILRCPLIPGFNDRDDHFQAIAQLAQAYPSLTVDLLPFHRFGGKKYADLGRKPLDLQPPTRATVKQWLEKVIAYGCPPERVRAL